MSFTPLMYEAITKRALEIANNTNVTDKKGLKKCFDAAIRETGYSPSYVAKVMRLHSPYVRGKHVDEFTPEDF